MAQDYYFNSHNPNNNNVDDSSLKKPAQSLSAQGSNKASNTKKDDTKKSSGSKRPPQQPASNEKLAFKTEFVKIILAVFIILGFTGLVVSMTVLINSISVVNGEVALDLDASKFAQAQTTFIYTVDEDKNEKELARLFGTENRIWVDYENVSKYMPMAFKAIEDKRFDDHNGVDWIRTIGAVVKYNGQQGGSTITQQLVKNLTDQKSVTFVRKYNEILTALNLEKHYEKQQIIEAYMNTVYLSHGCYGVMTAAEMYFGKDIKDLNLAECAAIAGITQWPNRYDPINKFDNNKKRQIKCLDYMLEQTKITQAEYDEAIAYPLVLRGSDGFVDYVKKSSNQQEQEASGEYQSYYIDYVIQDVIDSLIATGDYNASQAKKMIYGGGLKIYAAIDETVQGILEDVYVNRINMGKDDIQSAMVVMEYDGRVAGIVGGAGEKTGNRVLNRALSKRQPGSSFKPIGVYAPALEKNLINWSSKYLDAPSRLSGEKPWIEGNGWPTNQGEVFSNSHVTVQTAVEKSYNTVPVRILTELGFDDSYKFATENAHITTLDKERDIGYSPLALGGMTYGTNVLEMTAAYQMFGNGGYYCKPYSYYKVLNNVNKVILEGGKESDKSQAISPANATVMNKLLQTVMSSGTGSSYRIDSKYEMLGKTGTTTGSNDRWFVGATPYYVSAVWYGYDTPAEIRYNASANPCGTIWKTVYSRIHKEKNLEEKKFDVSPDAVQRSYCTSTGKLASKSCSSTASGWYSADNLPAYCKGGHTAPAAPSGSEADNAEVSVDE